MARHNLLKSPADHVSWGASGRGLTGFIFKDRWVGQQVVRLFVFQRARVWICVNVCACGYGVSVCERVWSCRKLESVGMCECESMFVEGI